MNIEIKDVKNLLNTNIINNELNIHICIENVDFKTQNILKDMTDN